MCRFFIRYLRTPVLRTVTTAMTTPEFRAEYVLNRLFYDRNKITPEILGRYTEAFEHPGTNYTFKRAAEDLVPENYDHLIARYDEVTVPTLIIWGNEDPVISVSLGRRLHRELPNSEFITIPKCGHIPQEECPTQTFESMKFFILDE